MEEEKKNRSIMADPQDNPRYSADTRYSGETNEDLEQTVMYQVKGNVSSSAKKKPVAKPASQPQE